ncbi:MAG: MotA/TolQ/ExbB proton channel family protein [Mariniphaga sp.]|nr:MotA/TolQ/ExbB proton channel family protein [Mariniphaga sp.]
MSLFEMYRAGGPIFMNIISLLAIGAIVITVIKIISLVKNQNISLKLLDLILMAGSLALAVGLLSQIVGITQALAAIREAADVSPQIIMGGAIVSFYAPIWGFIVFIFSMLSYFILKETIKARK